MEATQAFLNFCGMLTLVASAEVRSQADVAKGKNRFMRVSRLHFSLSIIPAPLMCIGMDDKQKAVSPPTHHYFPLPTLCKSPGLLTLLPGAQGQFFIAA